MVLSRSLAPNMNVEWPCNMPGCRTRRQTFIWPDVCFPPSGEGATSLPSSFFLSRSSPSIPLRLPSLDFLFPSPSPLPPFPLSLSHPLSLSPLLLFLSPFLSLPLTLLYPLFLSPLPRSFSPLFLSPLLRFFSPSSPLLCSSVSPLP